MNIDKILKELTLEEKASLCSGSDFWHTEEIKRLDIPSIMVSDGPHGLRKMRDDTDNPNEAIKAVCFPCACALACSFDRKLLTTLGKALGEECQAEDVSVILGPGCNIKRSPLCGRNFEYFSEDPYLASQLATAHIKGVQSKGVGTSLKHFAMNNQETERLWVNVEADERTMREIYFPAFQAVVQKAGAKSIMGSYNLIRGTHVCENKDIMGTVLRKEWGFDGTIISDWGAVHTTKGTAEGPLDIEMSVTSDFDDYFLANPLISEIRKGHIDEACVDEKVRNILRMMVRLHMIELTEVPDSDGKKKILVQKNKNRKAGSYNTAKHRFEVLKVARESITLLKNEDRKLPLDPAIDKVLVIGQNAVISQAMGGGSAEIKALYEITPLLGISKFLGGNCEVRYARGYDIPAKKESDHNWQEDSLDASKAAAETAKETEDSARLRKEAVELAEYLRDLGYMPEQVQDFYPTPSTLSTCMYYTGLDPRTMEKVYVPVNPHEKAMQRALMQYRNPHNYDLVREALIKAGREDLIGFGPECLIAPRKERWREKKWEERHDHRKKENKSRGKGKDRKKFRKY